MGKYKSGLDYFSFDVDFFNDEKIEFISAKFGAKGEIVTIKLLCKIYRNGYYLKWGEDECLLLSKKIGEGITVELINEIIKELFKRDFFNQKLFDEYQILTSRGIQRRYLDATKRRKEVIIYEEYFCLNNQNVNNISQNVNIMPLNVDILPQSKVKESKVKKSKEINEVQNKGFRDIKRSTGKTEKSLINKSIKEKKPANDIEFDFELWSWHGIDQDIKDKWEKIFPNVDIEIELNKIRLHFKKNPKYEKIIRDKFNNNYSIYIFDWMAREEKYIKDRGS